MQPLDIAPARLSNQLLGKKKCQTPSEVVAWLGAVQAQDFAAAKWALGLRLPQAIDTEIEKAFNDGAILRTHVMRPTWHFVAPQDIRSLLALTAPRVHAANASMYRKLELDNDLLSRCHAVFTKALRDKNYLTRSELANRLEENRIEAGGLRLAYIVMQAELEALICSGPRRGKQFTYSEKLLAMGNALTSVLILDGKIAGTWKRVIKKGRVEIMTNPFRPLRKDEHEAVKAAATGYGKFLEMPSVLS